MRKPYRYILAASVIISALLFLADMDDGPYVSWGQCIFEIVVFGGMYVVLFFLLMSGIYLLSQKLSKRQRKQL